MFCVYQSSNVRVQSQCRTTAIQCFRLDKENQIKFRVQSYIVTFQCGTGKVKLF